MLRIKKCFCCYVPGHQVLCHFPSCNCNPLYSGVCKFLNAWRSTPFFHPQLTIFPALSSVTAVYPVLYSHLRLDCNFVNACIIKMYNKRSLQRVMEITKKKKEKKTKRELALVLAASVYRWSTSPIKLWWHWNGFIGLGWFLSSPALFFFFKVKWPWSSALEKRYYRRNEQTRTTPYFVMGVVHFFSFWLINEFLSLLETDKMSCTCVSWRCLRVANSH